ncbi:MAG TPA: type II secretion system protein M [Dehalococcoidia bacterium]|nr:type II secretion system protein M [Dehalococcoidia bacterium]
MGDTGFIIGMFIGMSGGISIGIPMGRQQKPWSELTPREKRLRIGLAALGAILVVAGIVVFLLRAT